MQGKTKVTKQKQQSKNNKAKATKQKQQSKSNKAKATKQKQQNKSNKAKATKQKLKLWASAFAFDAKGLVYCVFYAVKY